VSYNIGDKIYAEQSNGDREYLGKVTGFSFDSNRPGVITYTVRRYDYTEFSFPEFTR